MGKTVSPRRQRVSPSPVTSHQSIRSRQLKANHPLQKRETSERVFQDHQMTLDSGKPVRPTGGQPPKRQGPAPAPLSPEDSAYMSARGGKASGNPDAKQGRKGVKSRRYSREFDDGSLSTSHCQSQSLDPDDKPQDKFSQSTQQSQSQNQTQSQPSFSFSFSQPVPLQSQRLHVPSSTRTSTDPRATPSAGKLNSKERSVSYTSPLDLFGESNLRAGKAAPLTEQNLRSHLRSLDAAASSPVPPLPSPSAATAAATAGRSHHRATAAFGEGFGAPPPPRPAASVPAPVPAPRPKPAPVPPTTATPTLTSDFRNYSAFATGMRKSKSPKKQDKDRDKDKKKAKHHDHDTHPLNLPPDQLRQLFTAQMARQEAEANTLRSSMSVDRDTPEPSDQPATNGSSPPATPSRDAPGAFPDHPSDNSTNGTNASEERSPTPPPHKVQAPKVDPEACKAAGNKFFKAKDYDRAIAEYTKAVDAEPSNPTYLSNRAAAFISANKYSQALGDSLQASRLDPKNDKILHRLARIYTSLGRPQDALDTYAKIPNASATDTAAARKALQSIDMAENQINSEDGNGNMALWSIDQAKQTLGTGTPTPRRWQLLRAKANLKIGSANSLGEVQGIAQNLMRENSMDAEAIVLAGRAFYLKDDKPRQGKSDYERAEDHFRQALALDPDNSDARNSLRTMKKLDRARTSANDMFKRGKYSDAVVGYTDAITIDPANKVTNAKLLGNRALARIKIKEYEEARADCDLALKLDPTYTKAKRTRAKATGESGDWEQAVKDLKAMVEENPSDPELNKELRNADLELKKSKRKDYYKILGVDKDSGDKDIERAYKRKAAVLHPDKTMGDKKKEEEFKDCLEAKETLLDPQKRHMYDSGADLMEPGMGGGMGGFPGGMGGFGGMGGGGGVQIDPEMLFNMMNGMGGGGGPGGGGGGFRFQSGGGGGRGGYSPFG